MDGNRNSIPLATVFGIPIRLDYSWFLIFGLLTWSLAVGYYPVHLTQQPDWFYWGLGAATAILLFVSVLFHEFGHAFVARAFHLPVRRIRLMIYGGAAEIGNEYPSALAEFSVALAGPVVTILTAGVAGLAWVALNAFQVSPSLVPMLQYLSSINLTLALLNMIPGFPLDGGRVLRAIVWHITQDMGKATRLAANVGRLIAFLLIGGGIIVSLLGRLDIGLWTVFIGWFMQRAAVDELRAQYVRGLLEGRTVGQLMTHNYAAIPGDVTLQQLVNAHIVGAGPRIFVVTRFGEPVGILTADQLQRVEPTRWPVTFVSELMRPLDQEKTIGPDTELWDALRQMEMAQITLLPVVEHGQLLGLISRNDVLGLLRNLRMVGPQAARI